MFSQSASQLTTPSTRLDNCDLLKKIPVLMARLKDKIIKLASDKTNEGADTLGYSKTQKLTYLYDELNARIEMFNAVSGIPTNDELLEFVAELYSIVEATRTEHGAILAWPRDKNREHASMAMGFLIYSLALLLASFSFFVAVFAALKVAPYVHDVARDKTGVASNKTDSIKLIDEWLQTLRMISMNLTPDSSKHLRILQNPVKAPSVVNMRILLKSCLQNATEQTELVTDAQIDAFMKDERTLAMLSQALIAQCSIAEDETPAAAASPSAALPPTIENPSSSSPTSPRLR